MLVCNTHFNPLPDFRNSKCSVYLEVDCSSYTIDTPVSGGLQLVIENIIDGNKTTGIIMFLHVSLTNCSSRQ